MRATWGGIDLYPASDPVEYARRKARVFSCPPQTLVFVPSVGLGYGLEELLSRLPSSCSILCVEAHQPVMGMALAQGLPQDKRLLVVRTDSEEVVARALREMGEWRFRRVTVVPLSAGYRLSPALYVRMRRSLEAQVREYWRNRLTLIALGSLQVRNLLSNITLFPQAGDFASLSTSLPVVVVGAGPSLEEQLPVIRDVRKDVLLLAVDTVLPRLTAEGLEPDVVVALEAQTVNLQDFLPSPLSRRIILACDISSLPSAARLFAPSIRFFSSEFAHLRLFSRMAGARILPCPFPALGSVGVAAVHAALRMTTGEVFLCGLDFSYPHSMTHARGTPYHLSTLAETTRLSPPGCLAFHALESRRKMRVPDKVGRPVLTDAVLLSYRDGLRRLVAAWEARVSDASSSGLDLGVRRIGAQQLKEKVRGSRARCVPLETPYPPLCSSEAARAFIRAEEQLLLRGSSLVQEALHSGTPSEACLSFLDEADYIWVHFPDTRGDQPPTRNFLARTSAAVHFYMQKLRRIESLL